MSANYVNDARNAEPITVYEETEEQQKQFYDDLWSVDEKPTTINKPSDIDWDELDDASEFEQVDEERAADMATKWFKFAYGYAGYGRGANRENLVVFKIPGWFASDELGDWNEWWFGNLAVAKEDPEDGFTAICFENIEPMDDRNEDSYFRNPIDEEWIPVSLMEFAFSVSEEIKDTHLLFERGLNSDEINSERGEKDDADIVVEYGKDSQFGRKFVLESPFKAKDDIKGLDWDQFHPNWNGDNWEIDADALWAFIDEMTMQGWSVCVSERAERETTNDSMDGGPYLPEEATGA